MSVPSSKIHIMSGVPLDNRYEHTLWFKDRDTQTEYFINKRVKSFTDYTYLRKTWDIKVQATLEEARGWSYLMFQNTAGRWYYYFINNIEYINDETVQLTLEMDVIQTYMFEWTMCQSFVERCHTASDEIGEHIVDEGLECGSLINAFSEDKSDLNDMYIMVLSTTDGSGAYAFGQMYNNVFSGLKVSAVSRANYMTLARHLDQLAEDGTIDSIIAIWMYPKALVQIPQTQEDQWLMDVIGVDYEPFFIDGLQYYIDNPETPPLFEGYTPKNNKLYTYPYNFINVDNNNGGSAVLRYELFQDNPVTDLHFNLTGCISPDGTVKLTPLYYSGVYEAHEHGLTIGSYPSCAWDSDIYKVWLAQNHNVQRNFITQQKVAATFATAESVASIFSLNFGGSVSSAHNAINAGLQIDALMAQRRDMDIQPPQAKGTFSSTVNVANDRQTFTFYRRCITKQFAEAIDNYFTRYGYKVNKIMTPNIHARERFTYIKTVGCLMGGNICNEDRVKIENIFDRGITFWDPDKSIIGAYLGDNPTL